MPRAKSDDLKGFQTTSRVAESLDLSAYLIRARIEDGTLPPASHVTDAGVLLFDDEWLAKARENLRSAPSRRRQRRMAEPEIPSPAAHFGHELGESGWLPRWAEVVEYFELLESHSQRITLSVEGHSTQGRPYLVVYVGLPDQVSAAGLDANRKALDTLWDSRDVDDKTLAPSIAQARSVGVILAAQHSNEIGSLLMTLQLAWEMAVATDSETLQVLTETITVLVPSHNPDGADMIAEWYLASVGTEWEGVDMPWLYHHYTGHDNNRDWFMQTQVETNAFIRMHNREHPQAVFDMHQMRRYGPRYMVPPFIDPLDPNQDPVIQQGFAALGSHIAQRMTAAGKAGVVTHAMFDNYSPSLAYGNYHGSVDLLSEAASAKLATPITLTKKDIRKDDRIDPTVRSWNQPLLWEPGEWTLQDIVSYNLVAARAFLEHLARNRQQWLRDYADLNRRTSSRSEKPYAFVIPGEARDPQALVELLDILQRGLVDLHRATNDIVVDGVTYPAGTWLVRLDQPAGTFAKTLLEVQVYPEMRATPGGPLLPPYDISGHTLPIQMGVTAFQVDTPLDDDLALELVETSVSRNPEAPQAAPGTNVWLIPARENAAMTAIAALHEQGTPIYRAKAVESDGLVEAGDVLVKQDDLDLEAATAIARDAGVSLTGVAVDSEADVWRQQPVKVGIYQSWTACIDEGWARFVLETYGTDYETLHNVDIRQGNLIERVDVLVLPEMESKDILHGREERPEVGDVFPAAYAGGIGAVGVAALRAFVAAGGTLIAVDRSASMVIDALVLPLENPLEKAGKDFSCPGSLLQVVIDSEHPLGWGLPRELAVLFMNGRTFRGTSGVVTTVARYPHTNPLLSGWISGESAIAGTGSLVDVTYGAGRVVLFGFRPWFRAQARGTYRTLFNAINRHGLVEGSLS